MKKLIGDVSRITGLSVNGIRYYEEQGVVKPERKGKYRYYSSDDLTAINRAVNYRAMGFTLPESAEMANIDNMGEIICRMEKRLEEIEQEQAALARLQSSVRRRLLQIKFVKERGTLCTLETNPHFIWMHTNPGGKDGSREEYLENYRLTNELQPEVSPGMVIPLGGLREMAPGEQRMMYSGQIAQMGTEAAKAISLRATNTIREFLPVLCIRAAVRVEGCRPPSNEELAHVFAFAKENDLEFCGDAFSQRAIALRDGKDGVSAFYIQIWFPVKKLKSKVDSPVKGGPILRLRLCRNSNRRETYEERQEDFGAGAGFGYASEHGCLPDRRPRRKRCRCCGTHCCPCCSYGSACRTRSSARTRGHLHPRYLCGYRHGYELGHRAECHLL